jgi:hypothetical protein
MLHFHSSVARLCSQLHALTPFSVGLPDTKIIAISDDLHNNKVCLKPSSTSFALLY